VNVALGDSRKTRQASKMQSRPHGQTRKIHAIAGFPKQPLRAGDKKTVVAWRMGNSPGDASAIAKPSLTAFTAGLKAQE
jgi:hypothetical protein